MKELLEKYRLYALYGAAELTGLLFSNTIHISIVFFAWAIVFIFMIQYSAIKIQIKRVKQLKAGEVPDAEEPLLKRLTTGKTKVQMIFLTLNIIAYLIALLFK